MQYAGTAIPFRSESSKVNKGEKFRQFRAREPRAEGLGRELFQEILHEPAQ
jgi:hypothetical protein